MLLSTYILHIVDKMADTTTVNNKIKNIISKTSIFRQFLYDLDDCNVCNSVRNPCTPHVCRTCPWVIYLTSNNITNTL